MVKQEFEIFKIRKEDEIQVADFIAENWGSPTIISKGKIHDVSKLPGFICRGHNNTIGLITYNIENNECEIVTLNSKINNQGLGSKLIRQIIDVAKEHDCKRVWAITTNDNLNAIRFYQKNGFEWVGFYKDAIKVSRKFKPEIPELGNDNIPIKHEIEFEYRL